MPSNMSLSKVTFCILVFHPEPKRAEGGRLHVSVAKGDGPMMLTKLSSREAGIWGGFQGDFAHDVPYLQEET